MAAVSSHWSNLNRDVLDLIVHKLDIVDFIHFSAVCRSWRSTTQTHRNHCQICPKTLNPWLLLAAPHDDREIKSHLDFYSMASQKVFNIPIPPFFIAVIGSSNGFLVTVDAAYNIHVINPLTGAHYPLPRISSAILEYFHRLKAVLHISSSSNLPYLVALLIDGMIVFIKFRELKWTKLAHAGFYHYEDEEEDNDDNFDEDIDDAVYHKGKLHLICESGTYEFDLDNHSERHTNLHFDGLGQPWNHMVESPNVDDLLLIARKIKYEHHMVESPNGDDLFLVARKFKHEVDDRILRWVTDRFMVYKFNETPERWDEIKDLGNLALFVGPNNLFFLPAFESPSVVARNNICFLDELESDGVGVFNLTDGGIRRLNLPFDLSQAFWFTPSFV